MYHDSLVFSEYNKYTDNKYDTYGIYTPNCGLENCFISYGHDEFLYQVLLNSGCKLPLPALYIVRYHSLYVWHTHGEYSHLENTNDLLAK